MKIKKSCVIQNEYYNKAMIFERNNSLKEKLFNLLDSLKTQQIIVLSDYPDPDSLISSVLLKYILNFKNIECRIISVTPVSHQETQAMMKILKLNDYIEFIDKNQISFENSGVWMVDGHGTQNFSALDNINEAVGIIDHHPETDVNIKCLYKDIFNDAGSTASIIVSYILDFFPELINENFINQYLLTGAVYAMRSDTGRGVYLKKFDYKIIEKISMHIDVNLLNVIESQTYSLETLMCFGDAINNIKIIGSDLLLSCINIVKFNNRDVIPQIADFLIKTDGVNTVIVYGVIVDKNKMPMNINGSLRTISDKMNVNNFLKNIFGVDSKTLKPYGGGRDYKGGFSIPIEGYFQTARNDESLKKLVEFTQLKISEDIEKYVKK